jgi:hypothetical protein
MASYGVLYIYRMIITITIYVLQQQQQHGIPVNECHISTLSNAIQMSSVHHIKIIHVKRTYSEGT